MDRKGSFGVAVSPTVSGERHAPPLARYAVAVLSTGAALAVQLLLKSYVAGEQYVNQPFFFGAVALSAWYGGLGPGLLAATLSVLAINFFFLAPVYSLELIYGRDAFALSVFGFIAVSITSLTGSLRRSREQAVRQAEQLQEQAVELELQTEQLQHQAVDLEMQREEAHGLADELKRTNERLHGTLADAERARMEANAARRRAETAAARTAQLHAITAAVASAVTRRDAADRSVREAVAVLGAASGAVAVLTGHGSEFVLESSVGFTPDSVSEWQRFPLSAAAPVADAVRARELIVLETPDDWRAHYPHLADDPAVSSGAAAAIPLLTNGLPVGGMFLGFRQPRTFDADDRAFMHAISRLCAQVMERARLFDVAERAREEAEAANHAKSDFLATMSHELRTPLNAILGYADLMDLHLAGPLTDGQQAYVERIRASGRHLLGLISEVLDLAKVEAGQLAVERDAGRLTDAVAGAVSLVRPQAGMRGVALSVDGDRETGALNEVPYVGDADRIQQVLVNLLSNAVKFTESGGRVRIVCGQADRSTADAAPSAEGRWSYVRIEDTGIGIPPEKLASVFEPFVQVQGGYTRTRSGTGLGLAISRRLARLMGGDITAESRVGEGSVFTLWLPAPATTGGNDLPERVEHSG